MSKTLGIYIRMKAIVRIRYLYAVASPVCISATQYVARACEEWFFIYLFRKLALFIFILSRLFTYDNSTVVSGN